jgi:hypothetical protein
MRVANIVPWASSYATRRAPIDPAAAAVRQVVFATARSRSGQHDDLATDPVLFYAAMRLEDIVELEDPTDLDPQPALGDLLDEFVERRPHEVFGSEVFGSAVIGRQANRGRDHVHRANSSNGAMRTIADAPQWAQDPSHGGRPTSLRRLAAPGCKVVIRWPDVPSAVIGRGEACSITLSASAKIDLCDVTRKSFASQELQQGLNRTFAALVDPRSDRSSPALNATARLR